MRKHFALPAHTSTEDVMRRVGYTFHCGKDGRPCYHRQLNDPPFPRFHAYVVEVNRQMEVDLHFDALDVIDHRSNHDQAWAYRGGRVEDEMRRITDILDGQKAPCVAGTERLEKKSKPEKTREDFFDLLFG
jgi:hypothetical protein